MPFRKILLDNLEILDALERSDTWLATGNCYIGSSINGLLIINNYYSPISSRLGDPRGMNTCSRAITHEARGNTYYLTSASLRDGPIKEASGRRRGVREGSYSNPIGL